MKNRIASPLAPLVGLLLSCGVAAALGSLPACSSSETTQGKPDGGGTGGATVDAGAGGSGGSGGSTPIFIPKEKCKSIGAANEVAESDARSQGQCMFLLDAFGTEELGDWPPAEFMMSLMKAEPAVFGNQYASFGFIADPNDEFPVGFKRGLVDATQMRETCALCHVGKLPDGRLWLGAPNTKLNFAAFRLAGNDRWVAAGHPPLMGPLQAQKLAGLGPGRTGAESGEYPFAVPADFPPYLSLSNRTHLNYIGTGGNLKTEVFFSIYSAGAGSPNDQTAKVPFPPDDRLDAYLAFFGTMEPPLPPAQDSAIVAKGKQVFDDAKCGSCHHPEDASLLDVVTYDKDPNGKERLPGEDAAFPRGSIRTDILHRVLVDDSVGPDAGVSDAGPDTGYADLIAFIITHHLSVGQTDGYRALDLHGLWATAPYLHNGSVPTLEDLLKKAPDRPVTWMRDGFLVDTTTLGNSNQGHEFGTDLSDADKQALVAYLKSL